MKTKHVLNYLKSKTFMYYARNVAVILMCIFCTCITYYRVISYDVGYDTAVLLNYLGILNSYTDKNDIDYTSDISEEELRAYLSGDCDTATAMRAAKKLIGHDYCSYQNDMLLFLKTVNSETEPNMQIEYKDSISALELYSILLAEIGYDISNINEGTLVFASKKGYGFIFPVADKQSLTIGEASMIIYETLFLKAANADLPVYRIRADINSEFKEKLLSVGMYDDLPLEYIPLYNDGIYIKDSYFSLLSVDMTSGDPKNEWASAYLNSSEDYRDKYIEDLYNSGWLLEGSYALSSKTSNDTIEDSVIYIIYKEVEVKAGGSLKNMEINLVLQYLSESHTLKLALLL